MLFLSYENRVVNEPGVRLLVSSIFAHMPGARLRLHFNPPDGRFALWASRYPGLDLRPARRPADLGWNIKPSLLVDALDGGEDEVIWLDADLMVTRDFRPVPLGLPGDCLIAAEEALWGKPGNRGGLRTREWGFAPGRDLPFAINSCVIRATAAHRALLLEWDKLLQSAPYRAMQARRWQERPAHMMGDQDVLTALLGSDRYRDLPLHILRRGTGILQLFGPTGFTLAERAGVLRRGLPYFVHAQGPKPWLNDSVDVYRDISPYLLCATTYADGEQPPGWTRPRTLLGGFLRRIGFGRAWLTGLPLAALFDLRRLAVAVVRRVRG